MIWQIRSIYDVIKKELHIEYTLEFSRLIELVKEGSVG